ATRCAEGSRQCPRDCREALGEVVVAAATKLDFGLSNVGKRAVAVPLRLEQPVGAAREVAGEAREHRLVAADMPAGGWRGGLVVLLAQDQPVLLLPGQLRRHERPEPFQFLPVEPDGQPAVLLLLDE